MDQTLSSVIGAFLLMLSLVLLVACFLPFVLKPRPWLWIYHLVIICLGLTSPCFMPFSIPLLVFWIKPETKAFYGKS